MAVLCDATYQQRIVEWIAEKDQAVANSTKARTFVFHQNHACFGNDDFSRYYVLARNPTVWGSDWVETNTDYSERFRSSLQDFDPTRPLPPLFDLSAPRTPQEAADSDSDQPDQGLVEDEDEPIPDEPDKDLAEQVAAHLESLSLNPDNPAPNEPSEPPSPDSNLANAMATPARPIERRIAAPEPFNGDRRFTKKFLKEVAVYLGINDEVYTTDTQKIAYALALFKGGTAQRWADSWRDSKVSDTGVLTFGTWGTFYTEVTNAFQEEGGPMKAAIKLANLKMTASAEAYVDDFKDLVQRAGLTNDIAIIRDFEHGLKKSIVDQIYVMETIPINPNGWYNAAIRFDNRQKSRRVYEGSDMRRPSDPTRPVSDPNAMLVDRMSIEERRRHVTGGLCFQCHKPGHLARDHKNGKIKENQGGSVFKGNNRQVRTVIVGDTPEEPEASTSGSQVEEQVPNTRIARLRAELSSLSQEEKLQTSEFMAEQGF